MWRVCGDTEFGIFTPVLAFGKRGQLMMSSISSRVYPGGEEGCSVHRCRFLTSLLYKERTEWFWSPPLWCEPVRFVSIPVPCSGVFFSADDSLCL